MKAHNLDDLYSFAMTDRSGSEFNNADEDNDTSFEMTGKTLDSGRIAFRMTYKLSTMHYYYYPDSDLAAMSADDKKAAKKFLTDDMDLDEGVDFASDMTKESAEKLMNKEMKEMKNDIENTYTLTEDNTGDNKNLIVDPEFAKGVKITLKKANSWEKDDDGQWADSKVDIASEYSKAYITGITNKYKKATIKVVKKDSYSTDKKAHGEAELEGAEFRLYEDKECKKIATVYDEKGNAKEAGVYVIKGGQVVTDYLRSGATYYLKEVKAPKGYVLSTEVLPVSADASGKTAEFTKELSTVEFGNKPVLGKVAVQKYYSEGKGRKLDAEANTTFQVYLSSKGSYEKCDDFERDTIKTNADGYAATKDLYYGKYTVHQVDSGDVDAYLVDDFQVEVTEDGKTYTYPLENMLFKAYLKILKIDGNTEKQVLKSGTTYQIYKVTDKGEELVQQSYSTGNKTETIDKFVTDDSGEIMTVKELKSGTYRIYETDSATGLHITKKYIEVVINSKADSYESYTDEEGYRHAIVTVTYTNAETYGKLKVYKTGEVLSDFQDGKFIYEKRFLKGVVFEVYAKEDIMTQDNQGTHWYAKGDLVATITTGEGAKFEKECKNITGFSTDKDGTVTVNLPLGKYEVKEKQTLYGYVLPEQSWDIEFDWKNKDDEFVLNATEATDKDGVLSVENTRAKTAVSLLKFDTVSRKTVKGAEFGIYTKHDIFNADGKKIVEAGTLLGTVTTDAEGKAVTGLDLPLMSEGYVRAEGTGQTEEPAPTATIGEAFATVIPAQTLSLSYQPKQKFSFMKAGEGAESTAAPSPTVTPETTPKATKAPEQSATPEATKAPEQSAAPETVSNGTLNSGDYYFKELSVSESYYLNETEYPVHLEYQDQETEVIAAEVQAEDTQTTVKVSKTSITNNEELAGCGLQITDEDGNVIVKWVSGDANSIVLNEKLEEMGYNHAEAFFDENGTLQINGLFHDTTYTMTETRPADGFVTAESIAFQLVEGEAGTTIVFVFQGEDMVRQEDAVVRMVDDTTKVEISKTDITGSEEIEGCRLQITDKETGEVIEKWTSTKEKHIIEQKFIAGKTYVLTEKKPADGYATAADVEFTVNDTGEVQGVQMKDDTTKIRLIKLGSDTGQGLRGAKFEVYDKDNKKVFSFTSKEDGYDITGILAVGGTYTFKEVEAPKGYQLAKAVKYTVKDTGEVQEISITDKKTPKPHVPQTGGNTPFTAVSFLLLLVGSGVYLFRKKKVRV